MKKKTYLIPLICIGICFSVATFLYAQEQDCLKCHGQLKKGKKVHPALDMGCSSCHASPHAKKKAELSLTSDVPDLCFNCHDKKKFNQKYQHSPVAGGMCGSCHNPHSSDNDKLLSSQPPDLCYNCHDKAPFTKKTVHPPVEAGQCTTCHSPHSSNNVAVLTSPAAELCAMCHDKQSSGRHIMSGYGLGDDHPTKGKPDPSQKGKELSCASCHNPHSSNVKALFVSETNLCLTCHKKVIIRQ